MGISRWGNYPSFITFFLCETLFLLSFLYLYPIHIITSHYHNQNLISENINLILCCCTINHNYNPLLSYTNKRRRTKHKSLCFRYTQSDLITQKRADFVEIISNLYIYLDLYMRNLFPGSIYFLPWQIYIQNLRKYTNNLYKLFSID